MKTDIVVIGGGPAGLLASAVAGKNGRRVILLEKNALIAKKLRITGKGRCNITNSADIGDFIEQVKSNSNFLYSAFYTFTNTDVIDLFENLGVKTKEERGGRIFPVSDKANDVAEALIHYAKSHGVKILKAEAKDVLQKDSKVYGVILTDGQVVACESVIIATGGVSYPQTGSTGDGYRFAEKAGHTVVAPKPSLVPLETAEEWVRDLQGLSLRNIAIQVLQDTRTVYTDFGEMLFTHFGVSGPVILSASANMEKLGQTPYKLLIDLKPALTEEQLDKRLQRDFQQNTNKNFANALNELLPKKLIPMMIQLSGIDQYTKVHQITKAQRLDFARLLKGLELTVVKPRPLKEAIITAGGVSTKQINPSTMESKLVQGLFFAGEVIDVDAYTGGFNLQIAFSTGYLAGINA